MIFRRKKQKDEEDEDEEYYTLSKSVKILTFLVLFISSLLRSPLGSSILYALLFVYLTFDIMIQREQQRRGEK